MAAIQTQQPGITFALRDDKDRARRLSSNSSNMAPDDIDEDFDPVEEKAISQDWSIKTDPKESWAIKERRRTSVFSAHDNYDITSTSPKSPRKLEGRRGSILSVWKSGKDKDGRDILVHDDHSFDEEEDDDSPIGSVLEKSVTGESVGSKGRGERRGSILSLWAPGKDEKGRSVIHHDDEEWKD